MNSDEYRIKLAAKLNALIAVLDVAIKKIEVSMTKPDADEERLGMICASLKNTLIICIRAKHSLESVVVDNKPPTNVGPSGAREYTEMSSLDEYNKFKNLPPIDAKDIADVDLRDLCNKLQED